MSMSQSTPTQHTKVLIPSGGMPRAIYFRLEELLSVLSKLTAGCVHCS